MKIKYRAVYFVLRASVSSLLTFLLVFFPGGRAVFASCSPAATNGDDTITCTSANDIINAQDGNDQVNGGSGSDSITGGAGNDTLIGGAGNDSFIFDTDTTLGTDIVTEASGGGTDSLDFSGSSNSINVNLGVTGNQTVNSNLIINMTAAQIENVIGGGNNDIIVGNALNNAFTGGAGDDSITGATGNDTYRFDTDIALGTDTIMEAASGGTDALNFSGSNNAITINLGVTGNQIINSNLIVNMPVAQVENVTGGNSNDNITGNALSNSFIGGAGNDILAGGAGSDFYNFDTDTALGADTITEAPGSGTDTLSFTGSTNAITVNLGILGNQTVNSNLALNLTALAVENVNGGSNNDNITGNALANRFTGGAGNDALSGAGGNDIYNFDTDTALGADTITETFGGGIDTLNFSGSTNIVTVNLGTVGNQTVNNNLTLNLTTTEMENVTGGSNNDSITGNALNNTFIGGAGNDTLIGAEGNDSYNFDTDTALGMDTITEVSGGGTDTLNFSGSTNIVTVNLGTIGNQSVNGNLTLNLTTTEMENVIGGGNNDNITGNALNNTLSGGTAGNDILNGMDGNDTLIGGAGSDSLFGGAGNDTYAFDADSALGTDTITDAVGNGTDTLDFTGTSSVVAVNLGSANQAVNSNLTLNLTAAQMENVIGGGGSDTLTGNALNNVLSGGTGGNDALNGMDGNDILIGGSGNDALLGGAGDDTYVFDTDTALGTDIITDAVGNGTDTLNFSDSSNAITVNLGTAGNQIVNPRLTLNLTAAQIENVIGGSNNDSITGNALDNILSGGSGNDALNGGNGNDALTGGSGNDSLTGGNGNDTYLFDTDSALGADALTEISGGGMDTLDFSGSSNDTTIDLNIIGNQTVNANLILNIINQQVENVNGGSGNDIISGNSLDNIFNGGDGNDTLITSLGVDTLDGGADDDQLIITGEHTAGDVITGGTGINIFVFQPGTSGSLELVSNGQDTLDFSLFDSAVTIDLNNYALQNVGGGLSLTLSGLFTAINGTVFNDSITGNTLDNTINGLEGNDALNGGSGSDTIQAGDGNDTVSGDSGVDTLNGEAGADTVINYETSDTHTSIENGFPTPPPSISTATASTDNNTAPTDTVSINKGTPFIPVTGESLLLIECDQNPFVLNSDQNSQLVFSNLCGYTVSLNKLSNAELAEMEVTPLSTLSIALFKDDNTLSQIPEGSKITWKVPATQSTTVYFLSANNNITEWIELDTQQVNGFYETTITEPGIYLLVEK
jgi:Ca2+-binding RTX toxin-like protein